MVFETEETPPISVKNKSGNKAHGLTEVSIRETQELEEAASLEGKSEQLNSKMKSTNGNLDEVQRI